MSPTFPNLLSAIHYQQYCPQCKKRIQLDEREFCERMEYPIGHPYQKLALPISSSTEDILYIYPADDRVELKLKTFPPVVVTGPGLTPVLHYHTPTVTGTLYQGLHFACRDCLGYRYTVGLKIDVGQSKIEEINLSSEAVYLEHGGKAYDIRSSYATKKTEYTVINTDTTRKLYSDSAKRLDLPLIPLNIQNPRETLERIQKLLVFS